MKVSPVAAGQGNSVNPNEGQSVSPDRLERAKQISRGEAPKERQQTGDYQSDRAQASINRIKMKVNRTTERHLAPTEAQTAPVDSLNDVSANNEPALETSEENKPLSPQFAALAKQKRALQIEKEAFLAEKQALETNPGSMKQLEEYKARIKANALSVLKEEGVTYDQLTEQILADNDGSSDFSALKAEIDALKKGLENQNKSMTEREAQQETQALAQIRREADQLIAQGDDFEMIREAGYAPKVVELIHKTFKTTGEIMDTTEAAGLIETELLEESLKFARLKKVQSSLNPAPKSPPVQQDRPNTKVMRTLTNRDGASSSTMTKRERAIAAMEGRLK